MSERSAKVNDIKNVVVHALESGFLRFSIHADKRMKERNILNVEVRQVLSKGHHESKKDTFDEIHRTWNYSIRGKTKDGRPLRIVIAIEKPDVLVVTAIDLEKE